MRSQNKPNKLLQFLQLFIFLLVGVSLGNSYIFAHAQKTTSSSSSLSVIDDNKWGMFKPHLLFCLTQKSMIPLNFGLIYSNTEEKQPVQNSLRWKFGNTKQGIFADFTANNGDDFAEEVIQDKDQGIIITLQFIKDEEKEWMMRAEFNSISNQIRNLNAYFYLSSSSYLNIPTALHQFRQFQSLSEDESEKQEVKLEILHSLKGIESDYFQLEQTSEMKSRSSSKVKILLQQIPLEQVYQMQRTVASQLNNDGGMREESQQDEQRPDKNVVIFHIQAEKISYEEVFFKFTNSTQSGKMSSLTPYTFNQIFSQKNEEFQWKIDTTFGKSNKELIRSVLSNLLGGIVFYHGRITVKNSQFISERLLQTVFSASPSRQIFPRAFLWDEGFHDSIICKWSKQLCQQFLNAWLQTQDVVGYISREQVRSPEISEMVPNNFRAQDSLEANPPTLILGLLRLIEGNEEKDISFIKKAFRKCEKWFKWFVTTQQAQQTSSQLLQKAKNNSTFLNEKKFPRYRWQCKGICEHGDFLGSGLDDYPRQDTGTTSEQHLDISSWLVFFSQSMESIANKIPQLNQKSFKYGEFKRDLTRQILSQFSDKQDSLFKDISISEVTQKEIFSHHIGYVTLFPLIFNIVQPNTTEFTSLLNILSDPEQLWSQYGIRSLSLKDPFYGKDDDYWRGAIWVPLNYLILRGLKLYYPFSTRAMDIYSKLRNNLIHTIQKNWSESGYLYETYNPANGNGQRGFPFNGWSSLVILILNEDYV